MRERLRGLGRQIADPSSWLGLTATPSSYLMGLTLVLTVAAKLATYGGISRSARDGGDLFAVIAPDATIYGALAALFVAGEQLELRGAFAIVFRWTIRVLAVLVACVGLFNAAYLWMVGSQLTAGVVELGVERLRDAWGIFLEALRLWALPAALAAGLALAAPLLSTVWLRRREDGRTPGSPLLASGFATLSLLCWVASPAPRSTAVAQLASNALLTTYTTWLQRTVADETPVVAVEPLDLGSLVRPGPPPPAELRHNVLLLVVESLRADYAGIAADSRASMPNLTALAAQGAWTLNARTQVPHTSKALFAIHCGRSPFWQPELQEVSGTLRVECLGDVLSAAGYATVFLQSALGAFEERARLVRQLGYERFQAWENIGGEPLGYLASDDLSLDRALAGWLDELPPDQPFAATLLTSAMHHPYRLPKGVEERLRAEGRDPDDLEAVERYRLLAERVDELLGAVLSTLRERGKADDTLVVVLGDHGEGFGDKGTRQHDNNYFEEGLRVPLVIAGPGIAPRELTTSVSVLDVAPSVTARLGYDSALPDHPLAGRDVLAPDPPPRLQYFSCYYDHYCYGFVSGARKLVILPELRRAMEFDLESDPLEENPGAIHREDGELGRLEELIPARRIEKTDPYYFPLQSDNGWYCPEHLACRHLRTPRGGFFGPSYAAECVDIEKEVPATAAGYDHVVHLNNHCSTATVCKVRDAEGEDVEEATLLPGDERRVTVAHGASRGDFVLNVDCDFR